MSYCDPYITYERSTIHRERIVAINAYIASFKQQLNREIFYLKDIMELTK